MEEAAQEQEWLSVRFTKRTFLCLGEDKRHFEIGEDLTLPNSPSNAAYLVHLIENGVAEPNNAAEPCSNCFETGEMAIGPVVDGKPYQMVPCIYCRTDDFKMALDALLVSLLAQKPQTAALTPPRNAARPKAEKKTATAKAPRTAGAPAPVVVEGQT